MKKRILVIFLLFSCCGSMAQVPYQLTFGVGPMIHFDDTSATKYVYIDSLNAANIWQIGIPGKILFDSAYSGPDAILTDTQNYYPSNNHSAFYLTLLRDEGFMYIQFWHQYNTDTLVDGGTIQISFDSGMSWGNVIDSSFLSLYQMAPNPGMAWNFYTRGDTIQSLGNQPGFSGNSIGWRYSAFSVFYQDANADLDTFLLRFVFASDSLNNSKEGWMIDNIIAGANHAGIKEYSPDKSSAFPNPFTNILTIHSSGKTVSEVALFDITSRKIVQRKFTGSITLNTWHLAKGLYIYEVRNKDGFFSKGKVIKK